MKKKPAAADDARKKMIQRMTRKDGQENIPPKVNEGLDMPFFMDKQRKGGLLSICEDPDLKEQLQAAAWKIWAAFGERIARKYFTGLFLFDAAVQAEEWAQSDGMAVRYVTQNGQLAYKIGIATGAVKGGGSYLLSVLLHEVCHVVNWTAYGHEAEWHAALDQMIAEYNQATGETLVNDGWDYNAEGGWRTTPGQPWLYER